MKDDEGEGVRRRDRIREKESTDLLRVFGAGLEGADRVGGTEGAPVPDLAAHCRLLGSKVTLM